MHQNETASTEVDLTPPGRPLVSRLVSGSLGAVCLYAAFAFLWARHWLPMIPMTLMALILAIVDGEMLLVVLALCIPLAGNVANHDYYLIAPALEVPLLAAVGGWLFKEALGTSTSSPWRPPLKWPLVFMALATVSAWTPILWSDFWPGCIRPDGIARFMAGDGPLGPLFPLRAWMTWVESFLLAAFALRHLTPAGLRKFSIAVAVGCVPMVLWSLWRFVSHDTSGAFLGINRAIGLFSGPNEFATYLLLCIPPILAQAARAKDWAQYGWVTLAGLALTALLATHSRGAWIGAGFAGIWLVPRGWSMQWQLIRRPVLALAIGLGVVGAVVIAQTPTIVTNARSSGRFYVATAAANMVVRHPLTGIGLGRFQNAVDHYYPKWVVPWAKHAHGHNLYLHVAGELGLPGLMALLILVWTWPPASTQNRPDPVILGFAGGVAAVWGHSLADYTLLVVPLSLLFWLEWACLQALASNQRVE